MRQITQCFDSKLSSLYQEAAALEALTARVRHHLNGKKPKKEHVPCFVGRFHQGCLTICVEDPIWATTLRYELPALRDKLRQEGLHHLSTIRISIKPAIQAKPVKQKKTLKISEKAKETIKHSADACTYEPLKEALKRLSSNSGAS